MKAWLGIPLAVAAVGISTWLTKLVEQPGPANLTVVVMAAVLGAFAPVYVEWLIRSRDKPPRKDEIVELKPPDLPASLLRAERGVVRFAGRETELPELREWCRNGTSRVRLLIGPAGVGKTRLALKLGQDLASTGWQVLSVRAGREQEAGQWLRGHQDGRFFLVVDYAETRPELDELLEAVAEHRGRIRVLLIARSAGDWWLRALSRPAGHLLAHAPPPRELSPVPGGEDARREMARAAAAYAGLRGRPVPSLTTIVLDGEVPVLVLHAAALVAVLRAEQDQPDREPGAEKPLVSDRDVLHELLRHERRFWVSTAPRELDELTKDRAVAVLCLFPARDEADAVQLLSRVPGLAGEENLRTRAAHWLRELYPPADQADQGYWRSLQPELVAETHVMDVLAKGEQLVADPAEIRPEQIRQMLTVLSLAGAHRPEAQATLVRLLCAELEAVGPDGVPAELFRQAFRVVRTSGGALGPALEEVLETAALTPRQLELIDAELPYPTTALAAASVVVVRRIRESLSKGVGLADEAHWLKRLARMQAQAGQPETLATIETALSRYQELVDSGKRWFGAHLADCLHLRAIQYAEQRRYAEAVEDARAAAERYDCFPDQHAGERAACLNNLGVWKVELDELSEAYRYLNEAVAAYETLIQSDKNSHLAAYIEAWNNRETCRAKLSRDSESSKQLVKHLVDLDTQFGNDEDRYRAEVAQALHNLGRRLLEEGQPDKALPHLRRAADEYTTLSGQSERYRADLAACQNNLAVAWFRSAARIRERTFDVRQAAVETAERALCEYRKLVESHPGRHDRDLAGVLDNLAWFLAVPDDQIGAGDRPILVRRAVRPLVALVPVRVVADRVAQRSRYQGALAYAEEAVTLHRTLVGEVPTQDGKLARDYQNRAKKELACALTNLGYCLSELERHHEALAVGEEAVLRHEDVLRRALHVADGADLYTIIAEKYRDRKDDWEPLARALNNLAVDYDALRRPADAADRRDRVRKLRGQRGTEAGGHWMNLPRLASLLRWPTAPPSTGNGRTCSGEKSGVGAGGAPSPDGQDGTDGG